MTFQHLEGLSQTELLAVSCSLTVDAVSSVSNSSQRQSQKKCDYGAFRWKLSSYLYKDAVENEGS